MENVSDKVQMDSAVKEVYQCVISVPQKGHGECSVWNVLCVGQALQTVFSHAICVAWGRVAIVLNTSSRSVVGSSSSS